MDDRRVIGEVNDALRGLLAPLLPAGTQIRFDAPTGAPAAGVNLFLAEIREDTQATPADADDVRDGRGVVVGRRPPIRRFDLHYLVTASAKDTTREDQLLDAVLGAVRPGWRIHPDLLTGTLAGTPVLARLAGDAAAAYARLGLPPRTVVGVVVNAPLVPAVDTVVAPPAERITLDVDPPGPPRGVEGRQPRAGRRRWRQAVIQEQRRAGGPGGADAVRGQAR